MKTTVLMLPATLVGLLALATTAVAQASPLPEDLRAHTDPELASVTRFSTPTPPAHESSVSVGYDNTHDAKTVSLLWRVRHGDAKPLLESRVESVSFSPIAVTASAGTTNRMFVAGWVERDAELVIEQWTVPSPVAIAQTIHPVTGAELTTAVIPRIVRKEIARLGETGPVWSIAVNPYGGASGRLLLLAYKNPAAGIAEVWEFDLETEQLLDAGGQGVASPLWTGQSMPGILGRANIWAANIPALGFVILVSDDKPFWTKQRATEFTFFIDSDLDGSYEIDGLLTRHEFLQAHPYTTWAPYSDP